ncbi:RidA family protein [Actinoplanes sp. NPDC023801]|uniref:RidA family protein n=1 Tax=Actinoplanes sp. NPDC023801 TaxID=3154595 RepID=UPI0033E7168F
MHIRSDPAGATDANSVEGNPPSGRVVTRLPGAVPGISDVVHVAGGLLFVSGQTALNDAADVPEDFDVELDQAFAALVAALAAAGAAPADLARVTIYVRDLPNRSLETIRAVRDRWIAPGSRPASALIGVAALFDPRVQVEIDAVAVAPAGNAPAGGAA